MKGIILAAGRGSRLAPVTDTQPKCMTVFAGARLIDRQIAAMRKAGLNDIAIVTGYRSEMLQLPGVTTFHNPNWAETQMVQSLICAEDWLLSDRCMISYSDIMYEAGAIASLMKSDSDISVGQYPDWRPLWEARFEDPLSDAESFQVDHDGMLQEIGQSVDTIDAIEGQFSGMLATTPNGWAQIKRTMDGFEEGYIEKVQVTGLLNRLLSCGLKIQAVSIEGPWYEIDDTNDLTVSESLFQALT